MTRRLPVRARLANRHRKQLTLSPGDRVVYRDPKTRSEGRVPWKKSLTGPFRVVSVKGNKAVLEDLTDLDGLHGAKKKPAAGSARRIEGHIEDMVLCPPDAEDLERRPELELEDASETP